MTSRIASSSQAVEPTPEDVGKEVGVEGWDDLRAFTGGLQPDDIDALKSVRDLESVYPLLHALVGRSLREFLVRAATLESLVASGRASFAAADFAEILF